ncbi:hypothetical protein BDP55DRAFT_731183 [Colletotrichum godetiae]|uniref:Uncharacterized protein n=1 Tax=Colletotrichum godetiae TaxID=1209918 RepID=A0AAJ0AG71_9PEZI|nr:uncharacterized protein BDP55DRAFT_731183 [Colletotrichum godetiae]KAK1672680.1 hypothetical protein BDP55DRAFT_731183 [Colletotrichum godetiae]
MACDLASDDEEMGEIHCAPIFAGPSVNGRPTATAGLENISKAFVDGRRLKDEQAEASRRLGREIWTAGRDPQATGPSDDLVRLVVEKLYGDARQNDARHDISHAFKAVDSAHDALEDAFRQLGDAALTIMPASSRPKGPGSSGSGRAFNGHH